jgi:hypothetical protein
LLAVFLGKDLGGCDTTNESWRTGKDLVGKSAEYVGFVGGELDWGRSPSVQSAHFEMVEMDKIVSKKRGWVTPASTQPTKKGDRTNGEQRSHLFPLY